MIAAETKKIAKYQPYPEYKDSGVDFLGSIPAHWQVAILKYECKFSGGGTPAKDNLTYWGGNIPWVSPKDMKFSSIYDSIDKITPIAVAESSTKIIQVNSLLMVVRSGILQRTIPVAINTVPVTLNQDMKAIQFCSKENSKFFFYYVQGLESQLLQEWCKQGATVESIEHEFLANSRYPTPPDGEIKLINQFLDYETARIDRLIAKQLQIIELLKEKRQAVISHAVTKGLNPNAPMKDSGIEWLGQVPEHWGVKRLKHISPKIGVGLVINPSHYVQENGVYFLFGGDIEEYGFKLENTRKMSDENSRKLPQSRLFENDLVCVRVGYPGITAVVTNDLDGSNCASMMVIRRGDFNSNWLAYCLNSDLGKKQVEVVQYGAAQKQYNIADAVEFRFPVPPIVEQFEISKYLKEQRDKFNALISKSHSTVQLLQERRTALISAAVTGKIDLRGWTQPAEEVAA